MRASDDRYILYPHASYSAPAPMNDQAYFQYQRFAGFDGQFRENVVLQSKNGPFDFQVGNAMRASKL